MDAITFAALEYFVAWAGWFALTSLLARKPAVEAWVTWDYIASTALLGVGTACLAAALVMEAAGALLSAAIVAAFVGLGVAARRAWAGARGPRVGALAAETEPALAGVKVRTRPQPQTLRVGRVASGSATVRGIEAMEVTL